MTKRPKLVLLLILLAACRPSGSRAAEPAVDAPLSPADAARTMTVPEGFHVTLFAGEPDVQQPIGFCIDDRGRLWVAEAYNYPQHGAKPGDRIIILEDADGDGRFDRRKVFYDQLNYVSGIEVGFGGAWVMSPPYFYFIPDKNGDDVPDGPPQVLLDGFGNHANAHNMANGFAWGPDGWLYGTHGRTNWSMIGKPGTPEQDRVRFDGGVYRYHPVRHVWEPYCDGTTNPWGIDWDDYGQAFMCNCVDPHLFQVIQGAHYEPWRNRESSRYAYQRIASIADHLHFVGKRNVRDGLGSTEEDTAGGGHAHCGTLVYLGDNWPAKYRNTVFMNNIHGHRINNDILKRAGSGYTASHGPDLMRSRDPWYMGVTLQCGPDGAVYASDWSDTGECHSVKNTHRETGRIYKIAYGQPPRRDVDLAKLGDQQLVELQLHANDWHVRHARRLLQERAAAGRDLTEVHRQLRGMFDEQKEVPRKLRAMWALYSTNGIDDAFLVRQLNHESEYLRSWAIQLLCNDRSPSTEALRRFAEMAASDKAAIVRLYLACALQRVDGEPRWEIAMALAERAEDANDQNVPLMVWYGIEPLVHTNAERVAGLCSSANLPVVRRHIARRVASLSGGDAAIDLLVRLATRSNEAERQSDLLRGLLEGFEGRRSVAMPKSWPTAYGVLTKSSTIPIQEQSLQLALIFDDPMALAALRSQASDTKGNPQVRRKAVDALVAKKPKDLAPLLLELAADPGVQSAALRGLAEYDHPQTARRLLALYGSMSTSARQDALQTLASRTAWAMAMLDAVEAKQIPRTDLSAFTARQLQSLNDKALSQRVQSLWGELRATPADKARQIAGLKRRLTPEAMQQADRSAGRGVFAKNCANCHKLFDAGGAIGPEITGAQRTNLDYLLENLVDPSAAISRDFQMQIIQTTGGRVITGLAVAENENAVTIQTVNEKVVVPRAEIEERATATVSMMPDRMLDKLSFEEIRDLISYLSSPGQAPLPAGAGL